MAPDRALLLTYGHRVVYPDSAPVATNQSLREDPGSSRRQNTRYGPHGLHEYKGKFHPQTPRSLILQTRWEMEFPILDPFAGTGTTLIEARGLGHVSEGVEVNALAAMIARAKLAWEESPATDPPSLSELETTDSIEWNEESAIYLENWFPATTLLEIGKALATCRSLTEPDALVAKAVLSNILRGYSWQDPGDLRIRRRKVIPYSPSFLSAFSAALTVEWDRRRRWVEAGLSSSECKVTMRPGDSRQLRHIRGNGLVAGSITSPPYACALPYVDTYRLSLVALGYCPPSQIGPMEYDTIGGRDIQKDDRTLFDARVNELPSDARRLIAKIQDRLDRDKSAGFRRKAVPYALARYLTQMLKVLRELREIEGTGAPNLWVIGPNMTTLLGERLPIPTPKLIAELAANAGFHSAELRRLDAYHRYGIHSKNAIREETLVRFYG